MTIIRLANGSLFLHSPVKLDADLRHAIHAIGPVSAIVAPNRLHHLFVGDYVAAYREARCYAAPGLPEKRKDLTFHAVLNDRAPDDWRGHIEQHLFRGAPPLNEIVFYHRASRSVIFTDLIFNLAREKSSEAPIFFWLLEAPGRFGPHRHREMRRNVPLRSFRECVTVRGGQARPNLRQTFVPACRSSGRCQWLTRIRQAFTNDSAVSTASPP
jgi:Domain of unknown function (DUF4336)